MSCSRSRRDTCFPTSRCEVLHHAPPDSNGFGSWTQTTLHFAGLPLPLAENAGFAPCLSVPSRVCYYYTTFSLIGCVVLYYLDYSICSVYEYTGWLFQYCVSCSTSNYASVLADSLQPLRTDINLSAFAILKSPY